MRILLRSPLHGLRSHRILLLEFRGRHSGRRYRMPVSYWEHTPLKIVCLTSAAWSRWWRNLDGADDETDKLGRVMRTAYGEVAAKAEADDLSLRVAAFELGIERVLDAARTRGYIS